MDDPFGFSNFRGARCGGDRSSSHNSVCARGSRIAKNLSNLHPFPSDFAPNRSLVVLKFFKPSDATEFAEAYNGKPFNSMEVGILLYFSLHCYLYSIC